MPSTCNSEASWKSDRHSATGNLRFSFNIAPIQPMNQFFWVKGGFHRRPTLPLHPSHCRTNSRRGSSDERISTSLDYEIVHNGVNVPPELKTVLLISSEDVTDISWRTSSFKKSMHTDTGAKKWRWHRQLRSNQMTVDLPERDGIKVFRGDWIGPSELQTEFAIPQDCLYFGQVTFECNEVLTVGIISWSFSSCSQLPLLILLEPEGESRSP